jgi:hypothetical protein
MRGIERTAHGIGRKALGTQLKAEGNEDTTQGIWCKVEGKKNLIFELLRLGKNRNYK